MKKIRIILSLLCLANVALAQKIDTTLQSEQIDIIKPYQPILADAVKIPFSPEVPKSNTEPIKLNYDIPAKLMQVPTQMADVKPTAMGKEKAKEALPTIFAKLGFGNYTSPYADLFYNNTSNTNLKCGVEIKHHSANSTTYTTSFSNQKFANTEANIFGKYFMKKNVLAAELHYHYDVYRPYGQEAVPFSGLATTGKIAYNIFSPVISFAKLNTEVTNELNYESTLNPYLISMKSVALSPTEAGLNWNNKLNKSFAGGHSVNFYASLAYNSFDIHQAIDAKSLALSNILKIDNGYRLQTKQSNALIILNPYYQLKRKDWQVQLGLNAAFNGNVFVLMPHYESSKSLIGDYLIFYNGWKGGVKKNSFMNFTTANPWMGYAEMNNTIFQDRYIGIRGSDKKAITYNVKFESMRYKHLPFYVNADSVDVSRFSVAYQHSAATVLNFHADAGYNKNDVIKIFADFDYYNFYNAVSVYYFHQPTITGGLHGEYTLNKKWNFTLAAKAWNNSKTMIGSLEKTIKGDVDLNAGVTYNYNKYISGFITVNNILGNNYQRYYGYPVYAQNGLIGVILKY